MMSSVLAATGGGMRFALALVAAVALVSASFVPSGGGLGLRLLTVAVQCLATLALLAAAAGFLLHPIRRRLADELTGVAGPAIVHALPPRVVLDALLKRVYGLHTGSYEPIITGILGGAGHSVGGADIAISTRATVHYQLRALDEGRVAARGSWTYRFPSAPKQDRFAIFCTCDRDIWNLILPNRKLPLFESLLIPDVDTFEEFIPKLRESLRVGLGYRDDAGRLHEVAPRSVDVEPVKHSGFADLVQLPRSVDPQNLHILQFDLWDIPDDDHVVTSIESLAIEADFLSSLDEGYLTYAVPYPSFVERVSFDVSGLAVGSPRLAFKVLPFTPRATGASTDEWSTGTHLREVVLNSWLLPGHGVALLWRSSEGVAGGERR
jgi:hypothetical protein